MFRRNQKNQETKPSAPNSPELSQPATVESLNQLGTVCSAVASMVQRRGGSEGVIGYTFSGEGNITRIRRQYGDRASIVEVVPAGDYWSVKSYEVINTSGGATPATEIAITEVTTKPGERQKRLFKDVDQSGFPTSAPLHPDESMPPIEEGNCQAYITELTGVLQAGGVHTEESIAFHGARGLIGGRHRQ